MIALFLFVIFGLIFGYFSTLNTSLISIYFGTSVIHDIPVYVLVLLSFGTGILFSALFYLLRSIPGWFAWGKKEKEITSAKKEIVDLTKRLHVLEIENTKLKVQNGEEETDEDSL